MRRADIAGRPYREAASTLTTARGSGTADSDNPVLRALGQATSAALTDAYERGLEASVQAFERAARAGDHPSVAIEWCRSWKRDRIAAEERAAIEAARMENDE